MSVSDLSDWIRDNIGPVNLPVDDGLIHIQPVPNRKKAWAAWVERARAEQLARDQEGQLTRIEEARRARYAAPGTTEADSGPGPEPSAPASSDPSPTAQPDATSGLVKPLLWAGAIWGAGRLLKWW